MWFVWASSSTRNRRLRRLALAGGAGALGLAGLETVLESSGNTLEVSHAAGTSGLSSLSLLRPVV